MIQSVARGYLARQRVLLWMTPKHARAATRLQCSYR
eukprot:CAMPEP_0206274622 /NCGR_PEP_ID=MMETSP0047_2-20121206/35261_1 /ASSEMBLY_ACC=CAM_ASM_000192 /TAXON_ID=195065 /ORGANISM="Chroomonas mesostigmatica_cf, Strain CCMP1168" /LENGTH=35 /DNA_ID= /DNA_START= /DNA_END= /DNA_ORIENTATION=